MTWMTKNLHRQGETTHLSKHQCSLFTTFQFPSKKKKKPVESVDLLSPNVTLMIRWQQIVSTHITDVMVKIQCLAVSM